MTDKETIESLKTDVSELEEQVKWLNGRLELNTINSAANFGAWLVNNHECRFSGGEDEIAQLCSEYCDYLKTYSSAKSVL